MYPRVPRPIRVEFRVGCKELIDDKKPAEPRPCTVELSEGCTVERYPAVPRPVTVEFRFEVTT
jgi:hypothetical protein